MTLDDVRICSICTEVYDEALHHPIKGSCGHSFCLSCIQKLLDNLLDFRCPSCREDRAFLALSKNYLALDLHKSLQKLSEENDVLKLKLKQEKNRTTVANNAQEDYVAEINEIFKEEKASFERDWLRHPFRSLKSLLGFGKGDEVAVVEETYKRLQKAYLTREERKEREEMVVKFSIAQIHVDNLKSRVQTQRRTIIWQKKQLEEYEEKCKQLRQRCRRQGGRPTMPQIGLDTNFLEIGFNPDELLDADAAAEAVHRLVTQLNIRNGY